MSKLVECRPEKINRQIKKSFLVLFCFLIQSHCVAQAGLEFSVLLSLPPKGKRSQLIRKNQCTLSVCWNKRTRLYIWCNLKSITDCLLPDYTGVTDHPKNQSISKSKFLGSSQVVEVEIWSEIFYIKGDENNIPSNFSELILSQKIQLSWMKWK
jgi:hypothetical protein